ncbi:helicase HerA domain-containing protein [Streptomyces sp. NPDC087294]|uniref:helicase HerA domain-containing protein n=1 Tax=Streptomyces sp. NPDC087294 TaxID=3365777 RepID=UPI003824D82E
MTQNLTAPASSLPERLGLSDPGVREQLAALPDSLALIGLTTDGQPVCVDVNNESPHVLVCSATGGGTTTVLRTLTAQFLHHGAHALILDLKRISHRWAHGLPGVTYCRDIADIHDALVGLQAELARRIHHIDQHGHADDLPRLTVVIEAADNTLNHLARHWGTVREKGDPLTPPAIAALEDLLFAGGHARIHILMAGHLKRPFGPEAREFFATLVLGRVTTRTWRHMAPQIGTVPKGNTHPGRVHVVQGLTAHPTQVLLMTDSEAAAWVTAMAAGETEED